MTEDRNGMRTESDNQRLLPTWVWILALVLTPPGIFIAYGYARLLSWRKAIFLAASAQVCLVGFVLLLGSLEAQPKGEFYQSLLSLLFMGILFAGGKFLHGLGERTNYWSNKAEKVWRRAKWGGIALTALLVVSAFVQFSFR